MPKIVRFPLSICLTTCGALLGVAPLLLYYFGSLSPYSFLSNPLAFPIVSVLLPGSLATNFLSLALPWEWLTPLLTINVCFAKILLDVSAWFPAVGLRFPQPTWLSLSVYYLTLGSVLGFGRIPRGKIEGECVR